MAHKPANDGQIGDTVTPEIRGENEGSLQQCTHVHRLGGPAKEHQRCVELSIPGAPAGATMRVQAQGDLTPGAIEALQAIGRAAIARLEAEASPPDFSAVTGQLTVRVSRRQQKRARVRAALLERRLRRRAGHDARWERQERAMHRWDERIAEDCHCCPMCSMTCEEVFQGAPCARRCDCDEEDERRLDDFYDDNDELDYGEGWEGAS